ncbi:MAG: outer membrane protein assembly factor BamA [Flavobacteriales bacterium]
MPQKLLLTLLFPLLTLALWAQPDRIGGKIDYATQREYRVAGVTIQGNATTDEGAIRLFAGIQIGQTISIPGDQIPKAIRNLWKQRLFSDVEVFASEFQGEDVYLTIVVQEMPKLAKYSFPGLRRGEAETIRERLRLIPGSIVNQDLKNRINQSIQEYFVDKGRFNVSTTVDEVPNTDGVNLVNLRININKGERVKIGEIQLNGVEAVKLKKAKRQLRNTKEKRWWSVFKASKYTEQEFREDKASLVTKYNEWGYRNARILRDTVERIDDKHIRLIVDVEEGNKFYFRDVTFSGNTVYTTGLMDTILNIKPGDVYNLSTLNARLYMNPSGLDITSMYQDNGYLNFQAIPVETLVGRDSIDIEVRMQEGKRFTVGTVTVTGNTKTNDHVIYREIRTLPGELFSRNDVIRTQRELAQLGYFDPQAFNILPRQNPEKGTVDIEYVVAEKPSDQIELSGGFGAGRIVGSLGLSFTNFSMRNIFKRNAWRPLPSGDGQRLSIRGQTTGRFFSSLNMSFVEPWLGGKKPNSLSVSLWTSVQGNNEPRRIDGEINPLRQEIRIVGAQVGLGQRLKHPDDYFLWQHSISYQNFTLRNNNLFFSFTDGTANNLAYQFQLSRNSVADPIFPWYGSNVSFTTKLTPPYHLFSGREDWTDATDQERYRWLEYYKLKFTTEWYTTLFEHKTGEEGNYHRLVLATKAGFGFLGAYNQDVGLSPFERFYLGGVFLSGFVLDGREIINLRGYDDLSLTQPNDNTGAPVIAKYNIELRYPLSTNPSAYIYTLAFAEAGKTWENFEDFNPFNVYRSAGVGLRIFLPMFGMLGLDYGWRLDDVPNQPNMPRGTFHFSIGANLGDL